MSSRDPSPQRADGVWSDGETMALIDAWGPLYVAGNRGHLPVKEWRAAASAVNAHRAAAGRSFNRTRVQCQTRLRTLKERYKRELKPPPSGWRDFSRLQAFLAGPPPDFPPKSLASIKKEEDEEEKCQEEVGRRGGLLGSSWNCPDEAKERGRGVLPGGGGDEAGGGLPARGAGKARRREGEDIDGEGEAVPEAVKVKEEKLDT